MAWFCLPKLESGEVRLAVGDKFRMRFQGELHKAWETVGHVNQILNVSYLLCSCYCCLLKYLLVEVSDEIGLELRRTEGVSAEPTHNFAADFVRKATNFDSMQLAI